MKTFIARLYKSEYEKLSKKMSTKDMTNAQLVELSFDKFLKQDKKKQNEYWQCLEFDRLKTYPFQVKFSDQFAEKFDYAAEMFNIKRGQLLRIVLMSMIEPK